MTVEEQRRAWTLTRVLKGALTMAEAAGELGLSERHLWRLRATFERHGPAGLVHGNRGRHHLVASSQRSGPASWGCGGPATASSTTATSPSCSRSGKGSS